MRTIVLTILLLAAAAPAHAATFGVEPTAAHQAKTAAPPPPSQDPAGHWSPKLRASVMNQCQKAFPDETICTCFTHQLELLSGDSEVVTSENIQAALKLCGQA